MEVHAQLHLIDTGASNVYLCLDDDGLTVVDSGMPGRAEKILDYIRDLGRDPAEVKRILVTHADLDHVGSVAAVQEATGAKVYANRASLDLMARGDMPRHLPWIAQIVSSLFSYESPDDDLTVQIRSQNRLPVLGETVVLATPGHTLDHISFYSPSTGILIVGDALNRRGGELSLTPPRITAEQAPAESSARLLANKEATTLVFGHGKPLTGSAADIKEQILALLD